MKKLLLYIIISLFFFSFANSGRKSYYVGNSELVLSKEVADLFIKYIKKSLKGRVGDQPITFWITEDGNNAYWWTTDGNSCTRTWDNEIYIISRSGILTYGTPDMCRGREHIPKFAEQCELYFKLDDFKECKVFARERVITWRNGVNPGRGKKSKINSKWSDEEILSKLNELGFGFKESIIKKTTSNNITENDELLHQLKTLKELYDDGILTKEEFTKAKKKLLN